MNTSNLIKIGIIDDHELFRDGLSLYLSLQPEFRVIINVDNPVLLHKQLLESLPDVLVMDIVMPSQSGIDLCKQLLNQYSKLKVLFLTGNESNAYLEQALKAGAKGFVPKSSAKNIVVEAIKKISSGEYYFPTTYSQEIFRQYINQINEKPHSTNLSDRELEVLRCFANGMSYKEIEDHLHISKKTVEQHKKAIFDKLGFSSNADLVKYAIKHHIIEL